MRHTHRHARTGRTVSINGIIFGKTRGTIPASALHLPCVVRATAAVLACYAVDMRGARYVASTSKLIHQTNVIVRTRTRSLFLAGDKLIYACMHPHYFTSTRQSMAMTGNERTKACTYVGE